MLQFEEQRHKVLAIEPDVKDLADALDINKKKEKIDDLEALASSEGFWNDVENSNKILKETASLKSTVREYETLCSMYEDALGMCELADMEGDLSLLDEVTTMVDNVIKKAADMQLATLLTGEYDKNNAILTFHAGAGGTEAQDWVLMLFRMYGKWAESRKFKMKTIDSLDGEGAGLKSAVVIIEGENAYGYLKSESGVHRLVRVSPFDASGRRHTSFASIEVMPEIDDNIQIEISPDDLQVDTFRASGAGGQHVNKTESAIRITHIPSGVVVACQTERSQHQNRETAMRMLKSKLIEIKEREHLDKIEDIKGVQMEIGWGSQIRSYVFMPYTMAKDHRTNYEVGNINGVMDGDLDGFINEYLKAAAKGEL